MPRTLAGLPQMMRRKVGTTSNQHDPYTLGNTHDTMAGTKGRETVKGEANPIKTGPSSD